MASPGPDLGGTHWRHPAPRVIWTIRGIDPVRRTRARSAGALGRSHARPWLRRGGSPRTALVWIMEVFTRDLRPHASISPSSPFSAWSIRGLCDARSGWQASDAALPACRRVRACVRVRVCAGVRARACARVRARVCARVCARARGLPRPADAHARVPRSPTSDRPPEAARESPVRRGARARRVPCDRRCRSLGARARGGAPAPGRDRAQGSGHADRTSGCPSIRAGDGCRYHGPALHQRRSFNGPGRVVDRDASSGDGVADQGT
jgi:hypothetical protein